MVENQYNNHNNFDNQEENSISLNDIWRMIWDYKWWYVASVACCLIVYIFYIYRTPNSYVRTAKVIIDESEQSATMRNLTSLSVGMGGLRANAQVANEMEAFRSPDLMQVVVERLRLETKYYDNQLLRTVELYQNNPVELKLVDGNPHTGFSFTVIRRDSNIVALQDFTVGSEEVAWSVDCVLGENVETPAGTIALLPTPYLDNFNNSIRISWSNSMSRAKAYCQKLSVSASSKESTVVVLSLSDNYPSRSEAILSTLIDSYNEVWVSNKNRSARNTSNFINERLLLIEKELGGVENSLKAYKQENKLSDMDAIAQKYIQESSAYSSKSFEVNNQLSIAKFIKDHLNDPANLTSLIPSNLGLASANVETQIAEYNEIVLQRDRLSTGSGSNNPLIADMNASLASMRSAILRSVDNYISTLQLQAQKLDHQEQLIMDRIAASSGQELQLLSIQRQQMVKEQLYIFLLQKREENEIAALVNVGNTRLIQNPNGSSSPVAPNRMMLLLAALVIGCGIPFGILFVLRMLDTAVHTKSDFANSIVPFLAEIPLLAKRNRLGYVTRKEKMNHNNTRIVVEHAKRDMMNEAYRVFRTNLDMVINKKPGEAYSVMLTSLNPNAGKTYTIMNIAASVSLKPAKVLLLDLDLRKATLTLALQKKLKNGVEAYLCGKENDFHPYISKVENRLENLYILPIGTLPPNPTELLLTERFVNMMEQLKKEYDYIFVDCPPIDIVADSALITKQVDMTIFVTRAGLLDKRSVQYLDNIYRENKYTRMSVILNGVDYQDRRYGGYGYGYGYGYGNGKN